MAAASDPAVTTPDGMLQYLMDKAAAADARYNEKAAKFEAAAAKWEANLGAEHADAFKLLMDAAKTVMIDAKQLLDDANQAVKDARASMLPGSGLPNALPPVDERTVSYWQKALRGELNLEAYATLQLPPDLAGSSRLVFVRDSYLELAHALLRQLQTFDDIGQGGNSAVYGTPGIGKSVFASLFVAWIGMNSPGATVLYTAAHTRASDEYLVFSPNGSVRYMSAAAGKALLMTLGNSQEERLVWVVADGKEPPSGALAETQNYRLRTVLVSSSNMGSKDWLREWHKHVYLPLLASPFSWDEVLLAALLRGVQQEAFPLADRCRVFGGVPRLIFESRVDPDQWLHEMVPRDQDKLLRILNDTAEGLQTQGAEKSRVVHLYPPVAVPPNKLRVDYYLRQAQFASPAAAAQLVANLSAANKRETAERLATANAAGDGAEVALLFEPWMHAKLKRAHLFVTPGGADPVVVMPAPARSHLFPAGTTLAAASVGVYMEPQSKNFASVDSFIRLADGRTLLFQMTRQASHPVNMPGLKKLFDVPVGTAGGCDYHAGKDKQGNDVTRCVFVPPGTTLVFVLMPHRLPAFALPQPFVGTRGSALQCAQGPEKYIAERLAQGKVAPHSFELE